MPPLGKRTREEAAVDDADSASALSHHQGSTAPANGAGGSGNGIGGGAKKSSSSGTGLTRLHHCFSAGDMIEAMFMDGCWVPGRVVEARARQIFVEYEKEAAECAEKAIDGPRHVCRENETPRDVSRKTGVPLPVLLQLNAERFPELNTTSRLKARTTLALPQVHVCNANETPRQVAKRFGRDLAALIEINAANIHGLTAGSKLRSKQQLVLPPKGDAAADEAGGGGGGGADGWLPPQLGELVELKCGVVRMRRAEADGTVLVPLEEEAAAAAAAEAGGKPAAADSASSSSGTAGSAAGGGSTRREWRLSEVVGLVAGGGFICRLCVEPTGGGSGGASSTSLGESHGGARSSSTAASSAGSQPADLYETSEELFRVGEAEAWRRVKPGRRILPGEEEEMERPIAVGSLVEVEVDDDQGVRWRPAEVRAMLEGGRFAVCVDGDEDFVEEYGPEDEGTEWRKRPRLVHAERRASEWTTHTFLRPTMPRPPRGYLNVTPPPLTVQVRALCI